MFVGISLQAFGVGAFEIEDEDIYGVESMANYDTVLGDEPMASEKKNFGWTAPKHASGWLTFCLCVVLAKELFIRQVPL